MRPLHTSGRWERRGGSNPPPGSFAPGFELDSDVEGVWNGGNPLVVCDVAAHACGTDYPRRAEYVAKFIDHIDPDRLSQAISILGWQPRPRVRQQQALPVK
ncbi:MAG TPA: hypothetical protein VMW56_18995 [Candidatus Margulisiibacteriota bacterium]|nr:hypothetical protein [Candidatus Margulisiibacteriota bacterium]